jgi:hypothetical protein
MDWLRVFIFKKTGSVQIYAKGFLNKGETIISRKVVARVNTAITLGSRSPLFDVYDCKIIPTMDVRRSHNIKLPS